MDSSLLIKTKDGSLNSYPLEDVIEANLKFPKEDFPEALEALKKNKKAAWLNGNFFTGRLAQSAERKFDVFEVRGSSPLPPTV